MEEDLSCKIVSAVVSYVQLLSDMNELCSDMYGGDTDDDEDNLVTIAANVDMLNTVDDEDESDDDPFGLRSLSTNTGSPFKKKKTDVDAYSIGFAEITVGLYTDLEFRQQFHMSRKTMENLCRKLVPLMVNAMAPRDNFIRSGRPSIRLEKKILITLWHLVNQQTFRNVAERFEVSTSTVESSLRQTVTALVDMAGKYIYWPDMESANEIKNNFASLTKIHGIVGVIGTARIRIKTVKETPKIYADSKLGGYTVTVQFVCENNLRFIDCYAGLPGGSSDASIMRTSDLYARASDDQSTWFHGNCFLIGGLSFPLEPWLITPFVDNGNLPNSKQLFNNAATLAIHKMLEALALLRGRFQRLNVLEFGRLDYLPMCISAAFVLHNFCLMEEPDEHNYINDYIQSGWDSVIQDYNHLITHQTSVSEVDELSDPDKWIQGCEIRNNLCNTFSSNISQQ